MKMEVHFLRSGKQRAAPAIDEGRSKTVKVASDGFASGSKPVQASFCAPKAAEGSAKPSSQLLYDKTLRSGDILVTETGVQIFRGQKACPHDANSFISLSNANISNNRRTVLLAIEDAMHRPSAYQMLIANDGVSE